MFARSKHGANQQARQDGTASHHGLDRNQKTVFNPPLISHLLQLPLSIDSSQPPPLPLIMGGKKKSPPKPLSGLLLEQFKNHYSSLLKAFEEEDDKISVIISAIKKNHILALPPFALPELFAKAKMAIAAEKRVAAFDVASSSLPLTEVMIRNGSSFTFETRTFEPILPTAEGEDTSPKRTVEASIEFQKPMTTEKEGSSLGPMAFSTPLADLKGRYQSLLQLAVNDSMKMD